MEVIWKVYVYIMNNMLQDAITLLNALHGFKQGVVIRTATMEKELAQQLAGLCHENIFQNFLDVCKYYDSLDRGICVYIFRGCGLGPNLQRLLQCFWDTWVVVSKAGKFFEHPFGIGRGVNKREPAFPTILNIVIDSVARAVLLKVYGHQESHNWLV